MMPVSLCALWMHPETVKKTYWQYRHHDKSTTPMRTTKIITDHNKAEGSHIFYVSDSDHRKKKEINMHGSDQKKQINSAASDRPAVLNCAQTPTTVQSVLMILCCGLWHPTAEGGEEKQVRRRRPPPAPPPPTAGWAPTSSRLP